MYKFVLSCASCEQKGVKTSPSEQKPILEGGCLPVRMVPAGVRNEPSFLKFMMETLQACFLVAKQKKKKYEQGVLHPEKNWFSSDKERKADRFGSTECTVCVQAGSNNHCKRSRKMPTFRKQRKWNTTSFKTKVSYIVGWPGELTYQRLPTHIT